ncbi:bifunctional 2',3'-cyclic-nucleotide 2'-phosphodiesterase/3'-nucleotidase [Undibacterium sp. RTI2.1]|uniref:bifunctional 2',3'-cyclic-nucleotide 2'-phosphodiesterase/3'-nucleotidase n=1 Tax=unclassified Undibacterium TaxID=2630295 RepID=UPI002AB42D36|nr:MULTISPECIES: bifunctional 2',3'-cyclic-nucleotide 2'-phosphodiesterase/3'-nucleotidase [unclassified Undibacterium]MDY7537366.1 bifunctional 2',3'-cyclic-nucleotide 2'-phosphodiesterase/3'-nucleotidase [Undibacterium sp. 5I1]MEB0032924.1 bifunctional 2',3'-cyclic-nucleotide 2'-phosphodiesterase/3'-nucleotidase [Undibacterium sp. RTI2.1]MEB0118824.1 bifunctional 2',3'-cyclic-nucleotide 2'-phosphodiesterase/3'-nucleotidase [Undibacterium sp. RTI2.2]MEB0232992.1 bifunctional 2',3'-cyclic-nucle
MTFKFATNLTLNVAPKLTRLTPIAAAIATLTIGLAGCGSTTPSLPSVAEGTTLQIGLLETTDIHSNVLSYNYYSLAADTSLGLERTSTLIQSARAENPNNVLLDDGDVIQGTLLGDYQAVAAPITCSSTLAVHKVMNGLQFDGGGMGNHEFNYGLGFLSQITNTDFGVTGVSKPAGTCGAPNFPVVLTNVNSVSSQKPIFQPYAVLPKQFTATAPDGSKVSVKLNIGIMSFVPPQIMDWDQKNLAGKVYVNGVQESAKQYVPELRSKGADLVVALSHGGLDATAYSPKMENGSLYLANTGIDALMIGHAHLIFPKGKEIGAAALDPSFTAFPASANVDAVNGFVNGVPTVMAQSWGRRLGIIKMTLIFQGGKWVVQPAKTTVESRGFKYLDGNNIVDADAKIAPLVATEHAATIAYAKQPLGVSTDFEMSSYFSLVGDVSAIQLVNQAQLDYVKNFIASSTDATLASYKNIPVISCSAPFKAGRNGPTDFTDVAPGAAPASTFALQVRNPGDLYLYSNNNLQAVKIKGADLKNWLETSAKQFAQIDITKAAEQDLVPSYSTIYNYDVFYAENNALQYQIDVTKPAGSRIAKLTYLGKTVADTDDFIVATNDYRAGGGGNFPGIDGSKTIIKSPDANQTVVSNYLQKLGTQTGKVSLASNGSAKSWSFVKTATAGPVILRSSPGHLALAKNAGLNLVTLEGGLDASGFSKYTIDLSK